MTRHLTEEEICRAIAGQSTLDEQRHAHDCGDCRAQIAQSRQAFAAFRADVGARANRQAPLALDLSGCAGDERHGRRALAAAALVGVIAAVAWQLRPTDVLTPVPASQHDAPAPGVFAGPAGPLPDEASEFLPLRYSTVPVTNGRVVRIEVPRSAPVAFGLDAAEFATLRSGGILADVVVGEDGLARAVRFVRKQGADVF